MLFSKKLKEKGKYQEALHSWRNHPEVTLVIEALKEEQAEVDRNLRTASLDNIQKLQGKAIALQDLSSYLIGK